MTKAHDQLHHDAAPKNPEVDVTFTDDPDNQSVVHYHEPDEAERGKRHNNTQPLPVTSQNQQYQPQAYEDQPIPHEEPPQRPNISEAPKRSASKRSASKRKVS